MVVDKIEKIINSLSSRVKKASDNISVSNEKGDSAARGGNGGGKKSAGQNDDQNANKNANKNVSQNKGKNAKKIANKGAFKIRGKNLKETICNLKSSVKKILSNPDLSNLEARILSALILIPLVLFCVYFSQNLFNALIVAVAILMSFEWIDLIRAAKNQSRWRLYGFIYILVPTASLIHLRSLSNGADIIIWILTMIWATDIAGYFAGKNIGGPKLAPTISPNKTWAGLIGGMAACSMVGFLSSFMFASGHIAFFMTLSAIVAAVEQGSDLLESKIKRHFGVKDSGALIPGHGGVLDRIDGMVLVAPLILIITILFGSIFS